jgi:hypothetical protein
MFFCLNICVSLCLWVDIGLSLRLWITRVIIKNGLLNTSVGTLVYVPLGLMLLHLCIHGSGCIYVFVYICRYSCVLVCLSICLHVCMYALMYADIIQTYRNTDIQTYRHTGQQTNRHTDIQTNRHTEQDCSKEQETFSKHLEFTRLLHISIILKFIVVFVT